ncbi:Ras GTPase activating protein ira2 [Nowakowskiella sp. JEL0407]|nr:Ras GTPase activating protein ira2 [Nowakowskiella sp. JEL0407]
MAMGDSKLLIALVNRLSEKLPINSNLPLSFLEHDPLFNQNVVAIVKLSQHRLKEVATALARLLDNVTKHVGEESYSSIDVLQTQLFILRVLGNCMAYNWKCHRESVTGSQPQQPAQRPVGVTGPVYITRATSSRKGLDDGALGSSSPRNTPQRSKSAPSSRTQKLSIHTVGKNSKANPLSPISAHASTSSSSSTTSVGSPAYIDPLPLEEPLAIFIIGVIIRFFHTSSNNVNPDYINHSFATFTAGQFEYQASIPTIGSGICGAVSSTSIANFFFSNFALGANVESLSSISFASAAETLPELHKAAGRILFFLSASNWNVVHLRIKNRVSYLTQAASNADARARGVSISSVGSTAVDNGIGVIDSGDLTELRFLDWCNLNKGRLSMIISDLTANIRLMPKRAQLLAAVSIRRAIWNWMEAFPMEFVDVCSAQSRLDVSPEDLFENFHNLADTARKKVVYWPTMTMLLVLCPDLLFSIGTGGNPGTDHNRAIHSSGLARKKQFLDALSQLLRHSGANSSFPENRPIAGVGVLGEGMAIKLSESAVFCYVDLCKAATFVSKEDGLALRSIVPNIESDLRDKLFDSNRYNTENRLGAVREIGVMGTPLPLINNPPGLSQREREEIKFAEDSLLDRRLMTESVTALFKLNPWNTLRGLIPVMLARDAPTLFRVVLVRMCYMIVNEQFPLPWNPNIDASLAAPLRQLFADHLNKDRYLENGRRKMENLGSNVIRPVDRRHKRYIMEEMMESRTEIVSSILKTWSRCPLLAIARDAKIISPDELRGLLAGVSSCLLDPFPTIRAKAAETLLQILDPDFVPNWDGTRPDWKNADVESVDVGKNGTEAAVKLFWKLSSHVLIAVSKQLLEVRADIIDPAAAVAGAVSKSLLKLLHDLLIRRNEYLRRQRADISLSTISAIPERFSACQTMESTLLVLLCSADIEMATTAGTCLGLLLEEAEITGEAAAVNGDDLSMSKLSSRSVLSVAISKDSGDLDSSMDSQRHRNTPSMISAKAVMSKNVQATSIIGNITNYQELRYLLEELKAGLPLGQKALQKKIRKIIRSSETPTDGNFGAWEEVYKRWRGLSQMLTTRIGSTSSTVECFRSGPGIFVYNVEDDEHAEEKKVERPAEIKEKDKERRLPKLFGKNTKPSANPDVTSRSEDASRDIPAANPVVTEEFIEDKGEWSNYTGFLCAMGGVCLSYSSTVEVTAKSTLSRNPSQTSSGQDSYFSESSTIMSPQTVLAYNPVTQSHTPVATTPGALGQLSKDAHPMINRFVGELVELLVCDNVRVREAVKEFLGNELASHLYGMLFTHLQNWVAGFFDKRTNEALITEKNTQFMEYAITVLKLTLDRAEELSQMDRLDQFAGIDFGTITNSFVQYVSRMSSAVTRQAPVILRISVKMCQLAEVLISKKEFISLPQEVRFRNRLMETMLEWNSEFQNMSKAPAPMHLSSATASAVDSLMMYISNPMSENYEDIEQLITSAVEQIITFKVNTETAKLKSDLDLATMKTMVTLLSGLPLQPSAEGHVNTNNQHNAGRRPVDDDDDSSVDPKSQLFNKYFSFFLKILQKFKIFETIEGMNFRPNMNSAPELQNLHEILVKSNAMNLHLRHLKEYTILALSNLLSSNIDIGLKFSLSMGYHEDLKTRSAFMQVLTNILKIGAADLFEGLAEEGQILQDRHERLLELVVSPDMTVVLALCEVTKVGDTDEIAKVLLNIFEKKGLSLQLLEAVVEREVQITKSPSTLLRQNSMATRLLTFYARAHGQGFLQSTLRPLLKDLVSRHPPLTFETDPNKLSPTEDLDTNLKNLKIVSQAFLDAIILNQKSLPPAMSAVCAMIARVVGAKIPDAALTAVGSFIFLRFVCPAIISPEVHELVIQPISSKELKRGLILIAKVIQSLANNVLLGLKENFMANFNDFLILNSPKVHGFLRDVAKSNPPTTIELPLNSRPDELDIRRLHALLAERIDNIERLQTSMLAGFYRKVPDGPEPVRSAAPSPLGIAHPSEPLLAAKQVIAQLSTLLAQMGAPPDVPKGSEITRGLTGLSDRDRPSGVVLTNQQILEFMVRVESRSNTMKEVESMKERKCLYEGPMSKERRPVFYYVARRFAPESLDLELVLYFVLTTLRSVINRPYDLVVDATRFSAENEWKVEWLTRFETLLPAEIMNNCQNVYVYNCNTALRKFLKKVQKLVTQRFLRRIIFVSSINELSEHIAQSELRLPSFTMSLERDISGIFSPASKISHYRSSVQVMFKMSQEYIQVTTTKKQEVMGLNAILNDVYHISDVEDVIARRSEDQEFVIRVAEKVAGTGYTIAGSSITTHINPLVFASPKRDQIINALRAAKTRFQLSTNSNIVENKRQLRPSDVPGTLLNMALLNIGAEDANLRSTSYNLLCALCASFEYDIGNQLLPAEGLCIPVNNQGFSSAVSKKLATVVPQLTPEFLLECCLGFSRSNKEQKHHCLEYMAPWLPNLAKVWRGGKFESDKKINEVLEHLIQITVQEHEMSNVIQSKIWMSVGESESMLAFVLDHFVVTAAKNGLASIHCEVLVNTVITLASANMKIVSGKIIGRLRRVIAATSSEPTSSLVQHNSWVEIAVLARFLLMLSFDNRLDVNQFLPEIFHIVTILVGIGSPLVRASIHGIVINVVQSLSTSPNLHESNVATLKLILTELSQPKYKLMFNCAGSSKTAFTFTAEVVVNDVIPDIPLRNLETIVNTLLDVMSYGALDSESSAVWKSRWMALITSSAFQNNPAIQPRTFVALGCLARDDVDDDLLYQILVSLRGALSMFEENRPGLIVSIVTSLSSIVGGLPSSSRYLKPMFWLSISLVQIGSIPIFIAALSLLEVIVRKLDVQGAFTESTLEYTLLEAREPFIDEATQLDMSNGILFSVDFPFAFAGTVLRGLKNSVTRAATMSALMTMLQVSVKQSRLVNPQPFAKIDADKLGYVLPLLPVAGKVQDVFIMAGCAETDIYEDGEDASMYSTTLGSVGFCGIGGQLPDSCMRLALFHRLFPFFTFRNPAYVTLCCAFLVTLLDPDNYDSEAHYIYGFLSDAAIAYPSEFVIVWDVLQGPINNALKKCQNAFLLQAIHSIVNTVVMLPPQTATASIGNSAVNHPSSNTNLQNSSSTTVNAVLSNGYNQRSNAPLSMGSSSMLPSVSTNSPFVNFVTDSGFAGLLEGVNFDFPREKLKKNANLACAVIDKITGL